MSGKAAEVKMQKKAYIFFGEEGYLRQLAVKELIHGMGLSMPELNHTVFGEKAQALDIINACETLPFMDGKRLVHVKNYEPLTGRGADAAKPLEDYIQKIPESTVLLFDTEGKADKRRRLYKAIEKEGCVREFMGLSRSNLRRTVCEEAKKRGLILTIDTAEMLITQSGQDLFTLTGELDKFAGFKQDGKITLEDIRKYAGRSFEYDVFRLHSLFMEGRAAEALILFNRVEEAEKSPFGVIGLLASKFRLILKARAMTDAGYKFADILKLIGANPYAAKEAVKEAKRFTQDELRSAIKELSTLDYRLKSGQGNRFLAETVFMKIYKSN